MSEEEWRLVFIVIVAMIASRRGVADMTMEATKTTSFEDPRSLSANLNHLILRARIEQLRSSGAIRMGQGHGPMGDPRIHVVPDGVPTASHPDAATTSTGQESPASPSPSVSPRPGPSGRPETPARGLFPDSPPAKRPRYEDVSPAAESSESNVEDEEFEYVEEQGEDDDPEMVEGDQESDDAETLDDTEDLEEDEEDALLGLDAFLDVSSSDSFIVISDPELDLMED